MLKPEHLVSILTPVYNGAKYLDECVSSILSQSYPNWEYTIINNCSTDDTLAIARRYEESDSRIRVVTNDHYVEVIENHNIAFRNISAQSKYCKVVSADDWLYPECIEKLVSMAEGNPSIGIVQSYVITAAGVRWPRLPVEESLFDGRQIGRLYLLGKIDFAAPSANLFRSSFVRSTDPFFPGANPNADAAGYLNCLQECDFGLVHQILSFERLHEGTITARIQKLDSYLLDRVDLLLRYGPIFLPADEMAEALEGMLQHYYGVLAKSILTIRGPEFGNYHRTRLKELGFKFYSVRLVKALLSQLLDLVLNPKHTVEKGMRRRLQSM